MSKRLSYALSVWAACTGIIFGLLAKRTPSVIFVRSLAGFVLFGILGYIAGWVVYRVMQPKPAFIDDDEEGTKVS
jgi:dolichol kinase